MSTKSRGETRDAYLRKKFGLTLEGFEALLTKQGGVCQVCGGRPTRDTGFVVAHDHDTGKVLGIWCRECNSAAGMAGDNPVILRKAARLISESRRARRPSYPTTHCGRGVRR